MTMSNLSREQLVDLLYYLGSTKVIDNGTDIPGTYLKEISSSCLQQINSSQVIISKGLGNFETLHGCNKNIYYMFLCKCDYFANKFNLNKWESVLTNEKLLDN